MYQEAFENIDAAAMAKANLLRTRPLASLVHSMMAGAYVGLGILLIFMLGTPLFAIKSPVQSLVMGSTFGIALSLVLIAGSDLFTGNAMIMPVGAIRGKCRWSDVLMVCTSSYIGNFLGSALVAFLAFKAGMFTDTALVEAVATKKMHLSFEALVSRGILCNWLVVLAVWCCYRSKSESGKLIMIWWCLLAFISSGYEHSVANMTLLTLANLLPHGEGISWSGMLDNLIPVTLGNFISGSVFVGLAYVFVGTKKKAA